MGLIEFKDLVFVYNLRNKEDLQWHSRVHFHGPDEYELHYFIQGEGRFLSGNTYRIQAGQLYFSFPGESHSVEVKSVDTPLIYYAILFRLDLQDSEAGLLMESIRGSSPLNIGSNYRFFFEEMREKALSADFFRRQSAVHQLLSFLYQLNSGNRSFHYGDDRNRHIERSLRIMQENVYNDLNLEDIARRLELSDSYFIRLFKDKMNITPKKYYTRLKVEAASSLLAGTEQPIHRIADRLKFSSEFHFSKVFKQYTGLSPRSYRKNIFEHRGSAKPGGFFA